MGKDTFSKHEVAKLLSDAILAPLAFSISPPRGGIIFADEQWEIAKSTIRTLTEYLYVENDALESDTVFIYSNEEDEMYSLNDLKKLTLEGLFSNTPELYKQLCTVIPSALEKHINAGGLDDYFYNLFSQEESTENKK